VSGWSERLGRLGALAGAVGALALTISALPWLRGDDPARSVLRARLQDYEPDPAALAAVRSELGLGANPVQGAAQWLGAAATGDFGTSWVQGRPVLDLLLPALGASTGLAAAALAVACVLALVLVAPLAWAAAGPPGAPGPLVRGARVLSGVAAAVPEFVLATVLLAVAAVRLGLAPGPGWFGPSSLVLPAVALGLPAGGLLARLVGVALEATAAEAWVRTWRAMDYGRITIVRALLQRSVTVAVPQVAIIFIGLLSALIVIEEIFAVPGAGRLSLQAALAQDLPVVQGCVLLLVLTAAGVSAMAIVAQRAMLGPARAASALAPAAAVRHPVRWSLPLCTGALLAAVILYGLLRDPDRVRLDRRLSQPSWAHPLGTDAVGRDVLARFGHGAVLTLGTAAAVTAVALVVGLALGLRGTTARVGVADVLYALPPVLVGLVVAAVLGPRLVAAAAAAALVAWSPIAVHTRSLAEEVRASGYYQAAVLSGAGTGWMLRRHLLPAVAGPAIVHALTRLPSNAQAIAALGFLGLGAGHDTPEWGAQLSTALDYLERAPAAVAAPVLGLALLGVLAGSVPAESAGRRQASRWGPGRRPGVIKNGFRTVWYSTPPAGPGK
jgi:peptide/nickel transport system permease protein